MLQISHQNKEQPTSNTPKGPGEFSSVLVEEYPEVAKEKYP